MTSLYSISNGTLTLDLHPGQSRAWQSRARFVAILAGTQGGKTSYLPWALWNELRATARDGELNDYIAVTATYDLFKLKFLPAMREVFEHVLRIGRYWSSDRVIELAAPDGTFLAKRADDPMWGRIILRSADSSSGLESSTVRAAILDEAGLYDLTAWEAVLRRLSLAQGRCFIGTTVYDLGWLKAQIYDPWVAGDPDYEVIQFDSTENPAFPKAEYERARKSLPGWKFDMMYRGRFTRPAGMIYDCFDRATHVCPPFAIPASWPRFLGLDFGGVNTAGVFIAQHPESKQCYLYREYLMGGRTGKEHAEALLAGEPMIPVAVGGAHSEGQWRREFRSGGLGIKEPDVAAVEIGISRVYGALSDPLPLQVFSSCAGTIGQIESYSREVNASGQPIEAIAAKATYHYLDAARYIVGWLRRTNKAGFV